MENDKLRIFLFVEHGSKEVSNSIYLIKPNLSPVRSFETDSLGFFGNTDIVSTLTFERGSKKNFLQESVMFPLDNLIYFFGGHNYKGCRYLEDEIEISEEFKLTVRVLDAYHPELGLRELAPLNYPKQTPSVFEADGKIYALGSGWYEDMWSCHEFETTKTGFFECYDPKTNHWKVLPDPPLSMEDRILSDWTDLATVVDRLVFIGNPGCIAIFNLDTQEWLQLDPNLPYTAFRYGSIYYQNHIYYLRGTGAPFSYAYDPENDRPLQFVSRGPLISKLRNNPSKFLNSKGLSVDRVSVIATDEELDGDALYTRDHFRTWKKIIHLRDHVFCYVVTAQLLQHGNYEVDEPGCRGVWVKFFKAAPSTKIKILGSFCYKISTSFDNNEMCIRCCVLGPIPDAWVKGEPLIQVPTENWVEQEDINPDQSHHDLEAGNKDCDVSLDEEMRILEEEFAAKRMAVLAKWQSNNTFTE